MAHNKEVWKRYSAKHRLEILERGRRYNASHKKQQKEWHDDHRAEKKEYDRVYHQANKVKRHIQFGEWKRVHPEKVSEYSRNRYLEKREHILAVCKQWKQGNKGKINFYSTKRRCALLKATPPWLTKQQWQKIEAKYLEATRISKETGMPHHVDHVFPLQGKNVSGLNVPWNLQILVGKENLRKSNKLLANAKSI